MGITDISRKRLELEHLELRFVRRGGRTVVQASPKCIDRLECNQLVGAEGHLASHDLAA